MDETTIDLLKQLTEKQQDLVHALIIELFSAEQAALSDDQPFRDRPHLEPNTTR